MAGLMVLAVVFAAKNPILHSRNLESEMNNRNIFLRAVDALVEGRTRQAERYVAQFERDHRTAQNKVNRS